MANKLGDASSPKSTNPARRGGNPNLGITNITPVQKGQNTGAKAARHKGSSGQPHARKGKIV